MRADGLPCVEVEPENGPATHSMILLHGLGADGHDLASLAEEWSLPAGVRLRTVLPHAPQRAITINGGMLMPAWYDIQMLDLMQRRQDERGIKASAASINALIAREIERGVAPANIVLAGFSQGGAMALYAGLRYPQRLCAIVAMSSYLIMAEELASERSAENLATPVFIGHGQYDEMVPLCGGESARDQLTAAGQPVAFHAYPMAHQICQPELADISRFLSKAFDQRAKV
jgi:phospholipase/carboxylesterase